jgi:hypothetical protein
MTRAHTAYCLGATGGEACHGHWAIGPCSCHLPQLPKVQLEGKRWASGPSS